MLKNLMGIFSANNWLVKDYSEWNTPSYRAVTHLEDVGRKDKYYLSHAELQQVQDVMREKLSSLEVNYSQCTLVAQCCKIRGDNATSSVFYNQAAKIKKRVKTLSAVQAKLKHSLITVG